MAIVRSKTRTSAGAINGRTAEGEVKYRYFQAIIKVINRDSFLVDVLVTLIITFGDLFAAKHLFENNCDGLGDVLVGVSASQHMSQPHVTWTGTERLNRLAVIKTLR